MKCRACGKDIVFVKRSTRGRILAIHASDLGSDKKANPPRSVKLELRRKLEMECFNGQR
jgi:hypothetical protein